MLIQIKRPFVALKVAEGVMELGRVLIDETDVKKM